MLVRKKNTDCETTVVKIGKRIFEGRRRKVVKCSPRVVEISSIASYVRGD